MTIRLTDVTKRFGSSLVVRNVSLSVENGELFVLLGGSGSGKSTILRIIAGLLPVDGGKVEIHGVDVTDTPPQARGTGFVFQGYSVFRHMTVQDNVEFGLRIRKVQGPERRRRATELLHLVGLTGLGTRYADQLSGGQLQRVALARALAYRPSVLLLDEPFGALDVRIRGQLRGALKTIQGELGLTAVLVTHDQEEAFELGDRIGVVHRGRIIEVGTPEDLYHQPRTEFVASFVGGGNVVSLRARDGRLSIGDLDLPGHTGGGSASLLIRPESVVVDPTAPPSGAGVHILGRGRVRERIFTGSQERIRLQIDTAPGVRSVTPSPPPGLTGLHLDALRPAELAGQPIDAGEDMWVGFSGFHPLEPTPFRVMAVPDTGADPGTDPATAFAGVLASTLSAAVDVCARRPGLPAAGHEGREAGSRLSSQLVLDAQHGDYDLIVMGGEGLARARDGAAGLGSEAAVLLMQTGIPVMIVRASRPALRRVLICTAAGEPGRADVSFGGTLAGRAGATATVFHALAPGAEGEAVARAEQHLREAEIMLDSLGVASDSVMQEAPVVDAVIGQARGGDYDLVVIGAPAPRTVGKVVWHDVARRIVTGVRRPVLLVPMPGGVS